MTLVERKLIAEALGFCAFHSGKGMKPYDHKPFVTLVYEMSADVEKMARAWREGWTAAKTHDHSGVGNI